MTDPVRVLSFGAGVQSTTLLLLSLGGQLERLDHVLFSDTGWEPARVYEHCAEMEERCRDAGVDFRRVSNGNIRQDLIDAAEGKVSRLDNPPVYTRDDQGVKRMLRRKCSRHYKSTPLDREITKIRREHGGSKVEQWFGISSDEVQRMRVSRRSTVEYRYPLAWEMRWSRHDCLRYLEKVGVDAPKSACIGCPYRSNRSWRILRDTDAQGWEDAVFIDRLIRGGLPGSTAAATFLHRDAVPLEDADLSTPEDHGQLDLLGFLNECEGMCGV